MPGRRTGPADCSASDLRADLKRLKRDTTSGESVARPAPRSRAKGAAASSRGSPALSPTLAGGPGHVGPGKSPHPKITPLAADVAPICHSFPDATIVSGRRNGYLLKR